MIGQYERNEKKNPTLASIQAICARLQISQRWLMYGTGEMSDAGDVPPSPEGARTYGSLPGWAEAEQQALALRPSYDGLIRGVRDAEVDEEPRMLTSVWVLYRADRWDAETPRDVKARYDRLAREEARQRDGAATGTHRTAHVVKSTTPTSG
jgi:transcriptional regulator with XRE-family HTH domain